MKYDGKYSLKENLFEGRGLGLLLESEEQARKQSGALAERKLACVLGVPYNKYQLAGRFTPGGKNMPADVVDKQGKNCECKTTTGSSVTLEGTKDMGGDIADLFDHLNGLSPKSAKRAAIVQGMTALGLNEATLCDTIKTEYFKGLDKFYVVKGDDVYLVPESAVSVVALSGYRSSPSVGYGVRCTVTLGAPVGSCTHEQQNEKARNEGGVEI